METEEAERLGLLLRLKRIRKQLERKQAPLQQDLSALHNTLFYPNGTEWVNLASGETFDFGEEVATSCHAGKIYNFGWARNVFGADECWHDPDDCFGDSIDEIKERIEKQRSRGKSWWISEVPVLAFKGKTKALLFGEIGVREPLCEFARGRRLDEKLSELVRQFQPDPKHAMLRIVCSTSAVPEDATPLSSYESISHGGQYRLEWRSVSSFYDPRSLRRLASRINRRLRTKE